MMKAFISIVSWAFAGKGAMNDLGIYLNSSGLGKSFIHGKCYKSSLCYSHHRVKSLDDEIRPQFVITKHDRSGINFHLVRALIWNQLCMIGVASVVLFSLYYFDENTVRLSFTWSSDTVNVYDAIGIPPNPLLLGLMGSIPSILMGVAIDRSDDHRFATANFSTVYTVMSLFGRRSVRSDVSEDGDVLKPMTHWTDVVFWSAIISLSTGVSEEMIFRLFLPFLIKTAFSSNSLSACLVQATIFGIGHMSTNVSCQENAIVGGFQLINGLCFGALYMLSGGDIIPCIVAHAVSNHLDTFVFLILNT
jgi:membrane protease YdiL (CAAX protease family)